MHELGIAQDMLKIALDYAAKHSANHITAFNIEIGATADESEDSLRFHMEHLARGTIADGARIEINRVAACARCLDCGNEFEWETLDAVCPRCDSSRMHVLPQDEFKLTSIEVE